MPVVLSGPSMRGSAAPMMADGRLVAYLGGDGAGAPRGCLMNSTVR